MSNWEWETDPAEIMTPSNPLVKASRCGSCGSSRDDFEQAKGCPNVGCPMERSNQP